MIKKVARTSTSAKDVSQSRFCNESDIFPTTLGKSESTQDAIK